MRRRAFFVLIGATAAWPLTVHAQQPSKSYRVGVLAAGGSNTPDLPLWAAFAQGFRDLGYIEGRNLVLEGRFAEGSLDRLPALVAELAALKVDVIVVFGPAPVAAAKAMAAGIPIVMVAGSSDPIGEGLIASFARPGGNITGLTYAVSSERFGKQLEMLKEVVGPLSRVAVLWDADLDLFRCSWAVPLEAAARELNLQIEAPFLVHKADDFESAFAAMAERKVEAVVVTSNSIMLQNKERVAKIALQHRLPTMAAFKEFPAVGLLMSYGPNLPSIYRRAAAFVDRILKGTPPADIPVEQPTKYDLVINLNTAKALGVTIPPSRLARADEVIE
jgi:putative tryptophan/tyrosine transport system substrate-binding protein